MDYLMRFECWFYRLCGVDHDWRDVPPQRVVKSSGAWTGTVRECRRCGAVG